MIQMLNRSRIKLELIIADKRYFFFQWACCTYSSSSFGKMASTVSYLITNCKRYFSRHDMCRPISLLIKYTVNCIVRPKKYYARFFASFLLLVVSVLIRSIIILFLSAFSLFFYFSYFLCSLLSPCCGMFAHHLNS